MPSWNEVLTEIKGHTIDEIRRKYLEQLAEYTGRNVIAYYSGWLNPRQNTPHYSVNDSDKNAFMSAIHGLDKSKGLDLILHTPGGDVAAAESLVHYLRKVFDTNIRAIIPQLAMSAGTMIACSCSSILMGKQSNLGPIDPQINGIPATGVIDEFQKACDEISQNPAITPLWQMIIQKYHPTFLGTCQSAITWAEKFVKECLMNGMFATDPDAETKANDIVSYLTARESTLNHSRHIHSEDLEKIGLNIECMETDNKLQDLVLTVHHAYMHTFSMTPALKIVENHSGEAMIILGRE